MGGFAGGGGAGSGTVYTRSLSPALPSKPRMRSARTLYAVFGTSGRCILSTTSLIGMGRGITGFMKATVSGRARAGVGVVTRPAAGGGGGGGAIGTEGFTLGKVSFGGGPALTMVSAAESGPITAKLATVRV